MAVTAPGRIPFQRIGRIVPVLAVFLTLTLPHATSWAATITVYAAASTADIMSRSARLFEEQTGHRIRLSVAASSALARQIENGAPADVYLSANVRWMDYLSKRNLIEAGSRRNLLRNRLVLIAPADGTADNDRALDASYRFADVLAGGRLALADPDHVPAGIYGRQALETLGAWDGVRDRLARAQNVRAALMLVARGEVPAGIVYRSDALATDRVRIIGRFPSDSHDAIVYPLAVVKGRQSPVVSAFLRHLDGPASRDLFRRHGFDTPGE